jgi:hypothetical protein
MIDAFAFNSKTIVRGFFHLSSCFWLLKSLAYMPMKVPNVQVMIGTPAYTGIRTNLHEKEELEGGSPRSAFAEYLSQGHTIEVSNAELIRCLHIKPAKPQIYPAPHGTSQGMVSPSPCGWSQFPKSSSPGQPLEIDIYNGMHQDVGLPPCLANTNSIAT